MRSLSARLSTKRRSPLAGVVVLLLGLLLTGGAFALFSPAQAQSSSSATDDVAKGRSLFLVGCASCHGQNAQGIRTKKGTQYAPSLVGVGAAAVDFQVGTGRMPAVQPGAQIPKKKVVYTDDQISQLAAYVASLGPGPAIPSSDQYDPNQIPEGERSAALVQGGEFFRTNCTACHNFAARGGALSHGKYAPSLHGVSAKHIYEALLTGPQQMPVFGDDNLTPEQKREVIAYVQGIQKQPGYGGFGLGDLGPVAEGTFAWIVGIGALVIAAIWIATATTRSTRKKGLKA